MRRITGLIGREDLVGQMLREIRKGKHVLLTGPVGIGKSAILGAAIRNIARRRSDRHQLDPLTEEAPLPDFERGERRRIQGLILVYVAEHQAKGQFLTIAKRRLETGLIKPSALDLAKSLDQKPPQEIEWVTIRRSVNRLSIPDLSGTIIPAIHYHKKNAGGKILIALDDMTRLTPTQQAFGCSSDTDTSMYGSFRKQHDVFWDLDGAFVGAG